MLSIAVRTSTRMTQERGQGQPKNSIGPTVHELGLWVTMTQNYITAETYTILQYVQGSDFKNSETRFTYINISRSPSFNV